MCGAFAGELLPGSGLRLPASLQSTLERAHATPPRAYHDASHVAEVLGHCRDLGESVAWRQPREVALAACFHDAIHLPGRRDNEQRSAEFAEREIAACASLSEVDADRVVELILLTARHGVLQPRDVDDEAARFLDCDMAVLGAAPERFDAYDRAIAVEYRGAVPGFMFRIKRRRFLRSLLASPAIYLSAEGRARWEAAARRNLQRALGSASGAEGNT